MIEQSLFLPTILWASGFLLICGKSSNSLRHKVPDLSVSSFLNLLDNLEISSWESLDSGKEDVTPIIDIVMVRSEYITY